MQTLMERTTDMLVLLSLLGLISNEGVSGRALVHISPGDLNLQSGETFNLSCRFMCLSGSHVAQLWKEYGTQDEEILINMTSTQPNVTLNLHINSATKAHIGKYSCMTQPPDTISPAVSVHITDNMTKPSSLTTTSTPKHHCTQGLQGQMWFWMILGKAVIFLLGLASLAVKHKMG